MNHEELSFFNQQLAAMLKSGLPLESSLKQLSSSMRRGKLREEIEKLEADLEQGTPLEEALGRRKLPELYVAMLRAGTKGNDLPGVLTVAADYYGNLHTTWLRLKGLMVYPGIVLVTSLLVSLFLALIYTRMVKESSGVFDAMVLGKEPTSLPMLLLQVWFPVAFLALASLAFFVVLFVRQLRHFVRWKLPGFREASLSHLALTFATMLENGADFGAALEMVQKNETAVAAQLELGAWRYRLENGARKFADIAQPGSLVPPLFVWLVTGAGENWARGFRRAAELYDRRAKYRTEVLLYAALPVAILLVAAIVGTEMLPLVQGFTRLLGMFDNLGE
jgi:type II secretory pathway component PulF